MERNLPLTNTTQESLTIGSTNWWLIWVFTLTEGVKFLQCFFFFFFVGLRTTYKIPIHPTPPPPKKKKIFVLRNRFLSPSQALSVDCEKWLRHIFKCVYDVLIVSVRRWIITFSCAQVNRSHICLPNFTPGLPFKVQINELWLEITSKTLNSKENHKKTIKEQRFIKFWRKWGKEHTLNPLTPRLNL